MRTWEKEIFMGMDDVLYGINMLDGNKKYLEDEDLKYKVDKSIEAIDTLRNGAKVENRESDWSKDIVMDTEFGRIVVEILGCRVDGYLFPKDSDEKITLFNLYEKYGHNETNGDKKRYVPPELVVIPGQNLKLKERNNGRPYFGITKKEVNKIAQGK